MKFLFQTPVPITGSRVRYDQETMNLYTINEQSADKGYYQTFGDLVLSFDESNGRFLFLSGRINVDSYKVSKSHAIPDAKSAYLLTSSLKLENIEDKVKYAFYEPGKMLTVKSRGASKGVSFAQVLENVVVGLSDSGTLQEIYISF